MNAFFARCVMGSRAQLSIAILLTLLLAGSAWSAKPEGEWACRTDASGNWNCAWSGGGEPPVPERPKSLVVPEMGRPAIADPDPGYYSSGGLAPSPHEPINADATSTAKPQAEAPARPPSREPVSTGVVKQSEVETGSIPAADTLTKEDGGPEKSAPQEDSPKPQEQTSKGGFFSGWFGSSDKSKPESPEQTPAQPEPAVAKPPPTAEVSKGSSTPSALDDLQGGGGNRRSVRAPVPVAPPPALSGEPPAPAAPPPSPPADAKTESKGTLTTLKSWFGMGGSKAATTSANPAPEPKPESGTVRGKDFGNLDVTPASGQEAPAAKPKTKNKAKKNPPPAAPAAEPAAATEATAATAAKGGRYSIQLSAASQRSGLDTLVQRHGLGDKAWIMSETRQGKPWYSLMLDRYDGAGEALDALRALPKDLADGAPWIRSLKAGE